MDSKIEAPEVSSNLHPSVTDEESRTPLILTERDIEVMKLCHEERFLIFSQVKSAFWPGRNDEANAANRRLRRLVEEKYLRKEYITRRAQNLYFLNPRGYGVLEDRKLHGGLELFTYREERDGSQIDHNIKVTNIRLLFKALGLEDWTPERVLLERDKKRFCPDGVLRLRGHKAAIEYETELKWKDRYEKRFAIYAELAQEYELVIYVVGSIVRTWLIDLDYNKDQICFVEYKHLMDKKEEAELRNKSSRVVLAQFL